MLAERNWLRASGRVHGAGDHGPNPAAEIAMQIVGRTTGAIDDAGAPSRSAVARASTRRRPRRRRDEPPSAAPRPAWPDRGFASPRSRERDVESLPPPLVWTFDGPFERCLDDLDDSLRRAIVLIGDVSRVALLIDLSLPALLRACAPATACSRPGAASPTASPATACPPFRACATCARPARSRRSSSPIAADHRHNESPSCP